MTDSLFEVCGLVYYLCEIRYVFMVGNCYLYLEALTKSGLLILTYLNILLTKLIKTY